MQELTTYYSDTRYDNLTSLISKGAKLAKLSALDRFKNNANKIKEKLKDANLEPVTTNVEVDMPEVSPTEINVENVSAQPETGQVKEESPQVEKTNIEFPTKESLEERTAGITFYNGFENAVSDSLGRRLRVADQVIKSMSYTLNTLGTTFKDEQVEAELSDEPTDETEISSAPENDYDLNAKNQQTFDFSSLPGVGENQELYKDEANADYGEPTYDEYATSEEQDNRLNDYLNREKSELSPGINSDLEEIRQLKREIEEARSSLQQVRNNVSDLQQKDSRMSQELAQLKQNLIEERNAVNQEILAETTQWNNLTQLVKEKEALMGEEEYSKSI